MQYYLVDLSDIHDSSSSPILVSRSWAQFLDLSKALELQTSLHWKPSSLQKVWLKRWFNTSAHSFPRIVYQTIYQISQSPLTDDKKYSSCLRQGKKIRAQYLLS